MKTTPAPVSTADVLPKREQIAGFSAPGPDAVPLLSRQSDRRPASAVKPA